MRKLQITCFVLGLVLISIQSVSHLYVKYFEHTASVLDRYAKDTEKEITVAITNAKSLAELVALYEPARKRVDELDAQMKMEEEKEIGDHPQDADQPRWQFRERFREKHPEEYEREGRFKSAITDWESKSKEIRKLRVYWVAGLCLFVLGGIVFRKF